MKNAATLRGFAAVVVAVMAMGLGRELRDSSNHRMAEPESPRAMLDLALESPSDMAISTVSRRVLDSMVDAWLVEGRDPFVVEAPVRPEPTPDPLPPVHQFQLSAVWVQPDRRLAVINGQVVRPGDRIGGCTLERCEPNAVWLANEVAARRLPLQRTPINSPRFSPP